MLILNNNLLTIYIIIYATLFKIKTTEKTRGKKNMKMRKKLLRVEKVLRIKTTIKVEKNMKMRKKLLKKDLVERWSVWFRSL